MKDLLPEQKIRLADLMGVRHNAEGTEFYGIAEDSGWAWMCVFHEHGTCVATVCQCDCHADAKRKAFDELRELEDQLGWRD